jgi:Zn-dependent peptidase ImmA (M78 family)
MANPTYYADRILDKLGIANHRDLRLLEEIAFQRKALVRNDPLQGAEARISIAGYGAIRAIITVSTSVSDPRRRRFGIAHELGHLEIHRRVAQFLLCSNTDIDDWEARGKANNHEQEANTFAAALLLPERFFKPRCQESDPSLGLIYDLSDEFDTSLTATARRYITFTPEPCAVVFSQNGYIQWFQGSQEFFELGLFVDVNAKVDPESTAGMFFRDHSVYERPSRGRASAWFRPGHFRRDATVSEQSCVMTNYNAVLTLLWIDEDLEDDEEDSFDE